MKWSITLQTGIVTLITFIFLGFFACTFFANDVEQVEAAKSLVHSHEVLRSVESLYANVKDVEIAQHDYQLSSNILNYQAWENTLTIAQKELNELAALTTDNTSEQLRIPWLDKLIFDWQEQLEEAKEKINIHPASLRNSTFAGSVSTTGEQIRAILSDMRHEEYKLLHMRSESFRQNNNRDLVNVEILIVIIFSLLSLSFFFVLYYERQKSKANRYLQEREEIFRQLADNVQEVFFVSSADATKCFYVSPAYEQLWGLSRKELYENPKALMEVVIPEDRARVTEILTGAGLAAESKGVEYRIVKPDGEERWIWSNTFPVKDENGTTIRLCGISHDITVRKEMEKRVSEFYSMVSHELRTPLTSIRAALGLLEGGIAGKLPEKAAQLTAVAKSESERLIRLINDILDIRKIAAGKLELNRQTIDPVSVIETTKKSLEAMATELHVQLLSEIKSNKKFSGDRDRITQVLTNLVSNALKFSPANSQVKIVLEDKGQVLKFSVTDQGPGIPAGKLDRLFHAFQQLDSSDTRAKGGSGLGLTISKAIVEEHGGTIGVNTAHGEGSTFWFELPLTEQQLISLTSQRRLDGMHRILIVEDDVQLAELLKLRLQQDGYDLVIAPTLKVASEFLDNEPIEAIILDIQLPDGNGLDWAKTVRSLPGAKIIPIIVITGTETEMNTYTLPLLIAWLHKPFQENELIQALQVAVKSESPRKAKILIVEDDRSSRNLIIDSLQHLDIQFLEAADGITAIDMAKREKPDLIILDIGLPYKDGFTVVEVLREDKSQNTPLLVYTSRDINKEDMQKLTLGLTKHLTKSRTSEAQFLDTVRELLIGVTRPKEKEPVK